MSDVGDGFDVRSLALTFRAGATLGRHDHPWGQLVFASRGVMRVATPEAVWLVPATRAIWLPPRLPHEIAMRGEVAMRTLYIAPARARGLPSSPLALEVAPLLRELILHILSIGMLAPDRPDHDRMAGVLVDLLAQAARLDLHLPMPSEPRALAFAERLHDRRDLAVLAADLGVGLRSLQRRFPAETGLTLEAWRRRARLIHAAAALSTGASVTIAALDSGYDSLGAFIAAFRSQFGLTPGRYRGG